MADQGAAEAAARRLPDVASRALGGAVLYANDEFYADAHNLIAPQPAAHDPVAFGVRGKLYDGWETRRRREPGEDFAIVRLAAPAVVRGVTIDTAHFKGNYPPFGSVEGATLLGYPSVAEVLAAEWHSRGQDRPRRRLRQCRARERARPDRDPRPADHLPGRRRRAPAGFR